MFLAQPLLKSVIGPDGKVQLFDIFVNGKWHGSRRTALQCVEYLRGIGAYARRGNDHNQKESEGDD